jgi:hypothetical protein
MWYYTIRSHIFNSEYSGKPLNISLVLYIYETKDNPSGA